ncbi:helix-turn-helix domain-containing protein [Sphingomonas sp.]|uniref:helix-turn-helix domain-containing protein n=1 Tax=Sphingomonas sp. TaxID=28214 RepID=UPI00307EC8C7
MISYRSIAVQIAPGDVVAMLESSPRPAAIRFEPVGEPDPAAPWRKVGKATQLVAAETGIGVAEIVGDRRYQRLVRARAAVAWVARKTSDRTLHQIARALGRTDHTTVRQMLRKAEQLRAADPAFRAMTDRVADFVSAGVAS